MTIPFARPTFPEIYERELVGPLFSPWADLILDDVRLGAGDRVLDVACGTGIVGRMASSRLGGEGSVTGVDLSPAMLEVARRVAPSIDWREGDATALPLRDGEQFDVVICQQGLQFFPDRPAAVRQMHAALGDGGRVAVSTWRPDEELPLLHALRRVAERHLGPVEDRRHSFGEAGPVEALLRDAGFGDIASRTVTQRIRFADGDTFVRLNAMALAGMSAASKELGEEERLRVADAIVSDSTGTTRPFTDAAGLTFELAATVATARK